MDLDLSKVRADTKIHLTVITESDQATYSLDLDSQDTVSHTFTDFP